MDVKVVGIDIAKRYFQVHGISASGVVTLRRKISRDGFLKLFADLPPCLVGLEAGSGAHHWAREIARLGHDVKLMPPQFVRPYVRPTKMTLRTPKHVARRSSVRACGLCRSSHASNRLQWRCTVCAIILFVSVPARLMP